MKSFSGTCECPACGNGSVAVQYEHGNPSGGYLRNQYKDKLRRTCNLCGYVWHEEPKFSQKEE